MRQMALPLDRGESSETHPDPAPQATPYHYVVTVMSDPDGMGRQLFSMDWFDPNFWSGPQQRGQFFHARLAEYVECPRRLKRGDTFEIVDGRDAAAKKRAKR